MKRLKKAFIIILFMMVALLTQRSFVLASEAVVEERVFFLNEQEYKEQEYIGKDLISFKKSTSLPSKYNLADIIPIIVKNQKTMSNCWAFTATSMFETNISLRNGVDYEFSTRHMEYSTVRNFLNGETNIGGFNKAPGDGGHSMMATAYATRGSGPILEEEMPVEDNENMIALSAIQNKTPVRKLDSFVEFPSIRKTRVGDNITYTDESGGTYTLAQVENIRDEIKEHIKLYGGITATIAQGYINYGKQAMYSPNKDEPVNHAAIIIGWDDDYAKENFTAGTRPMNNGAWICLNSWGDYTPDGLLVVSYEDAYIEEQLGGIISMSKIDYNTIYQYDLLTPGVMFGGTYGANVFTRKNARPEQLTEVGVWLTAAGSVEIYVNNQDGTLASSRFTKRATTQNLKEGYYSIKLDNPVTLTGTKFAVAVKYSSQRISIQTPMQYQTATSTSSTGQSFCGDSLDSMTDIWNHPSGYGQNGSVCIKAFTKYTDTQEGVTALKINQRSLQLKIGDMKKLEAVLKPSTVLGKTVSWSSSNASVIAVSQDGTVTAKAGGSANITATVDGITVTCLVTVAEAEIEPTSVTLNKSTLTLRLQQVEKLTATVLPGNSTNKSVTWESNNPAVATVSTDGTVTAKTAGSAIITVKTVAGNKTATCNVTVTEEPAIPPTSVTLNRNTLTLGLNQTEELIATVLPENSTNKSVTWTSNNPAVAQVFSDGTVTGKIVGTAIITVKTVEGNKEATCTVTVQSTGSPGTVSSATYQVVDSTQQIQKVPAGATKAEFLSNIVTPEGEPKIYTKEGQEVTSENSKMTTGTILRVYGRDYILVITGDINGDGEANVVDLARLKMHSLGISNMKLEGQYLRAADINYDNMVNITDIARVKLMILGINL